MVVSADDFSSLLGSLNELMDRQFVMRCASVTDRCSERSSDRDITVARVRALQSVPALSKNIFNTRVLKMLIDSMTHLDFSPGDKILNQASVRLAERALFARD